MKAQMIERYIGLRKDNAFVGIFIPCLSILPIILGIIIGEFSGLMISTLGLIALILGCIFIEIQRGNDMQFAYVGFTITDRKQISKDFWKEKKK